MPRFTQMHIIDDALSQDLLQRAFEDFCRDAANEFRPLRTGLAPPSLGHVRMPPRHNEMSSRPPGNQR
jgi:hypothetical protein